MARRLVAVALAVACAAVTGACTSVPSSSGARVVRRVPAEDAGPAEPFVTRRLRPPAPDAKPDEIVRGFLIAHSVPLDNYADARRYLAPQATWDTRGRAVVYDARTLRAPRTSGDTATVSVRFAAVGTVSPAGEYQARTAPVDVTFRLRRVPDLGWRLDDAPAGLLLTRAYVTSSFQRAMLYWPDQARRLVPQPVFLRSDEHHVTAVVRALLAGPRGWLAPAVRTAVPPGTELLDPPEIVGDTATLNFSREIGGAAQEALATIVAQVVWTVTERPEIRVVRVLAEGRPLHVPGRPGVTDHRREDWLEYAPVPVTTDRRLFFVRNGVPYSFDESGRAARVANLTDVVSVAVNRAGTALAAVTRAGERQAFVVVDLTGAEPPRTEFVADAITPPTWEPGGALAWAVRTVGSTQQVVAVPAGGGPVATVRAPALPSPVTALRLSPDGARAAFVAGPERTASLWVARVERLASGTRVLDGPVRIVPSVRGVTAVAFEGSAQLLVAARSGDRPALHRADVDGYRLEPLRDAGLPSGPVTALAVSAGLPADRVAASDGRLWRRTPAAEWAPLRLRGRAAAFAG